MAKKHRNQPPHIKEMQERCYNNRKIDLFEAKDFGECIVVKRNKGKARK